MAAGDSANGLGSSRLGPAEREAALDRMGTDEFDVVVVGGGIVGAGVALDAATRGLKVALVEARDFASGTSSRSSKLIHGGLRYLEQRDFELVREALTERGLLLGRIAPHLVRPVPFLFPMTHRVWERAYIGAGIALYDGLSLSMGTSRGVPRHRHLTRTKALRVAPSLKRNSFVGAIQYWDAQVDDARYVTMLLRTAAEYGAQIVSRTQAVGFLREGERVTGVRIRDLESERDTEVRAKQVVNATGVWTDDIQELVGGRGQIHVRASKGVHLVVPKDRIHSASGIILRTEKSVLFVIPWGRHWIIGTTDTPWDLDKDHPAASKADIDYVLEHVNAVLNVPLTHDDVEGVYAGLRPLLSGEDDATSKLSREHAVVEPMLGLILIAGGKYTTYRVMAEDAVDVAARRLPEVPRSRTDELVLVGGDGYSAAWSGRAATARRHGVSVGVVEHLLERYGTLTNEVLALVEADPTLGRPLTGAPEYLRAEVVYAAEAEGALHLDDVLTRRTRISIETPHRGLDSVEEVADLVGKVLGWDAGTRRQEVEHYRARVEAERESQRMLDDQTADAARLGAADVRGLHSD
jgi:glycerol-3-phosphate dehydrogenase